MPRLISKEADVTISTASKWLDKYRYLKNLFSDHLVFIEVGDFFETYLDDAVTASKKLELVLTSKKSGDDRVAMAGIPAHAIERYARQLANKGICVYLNHKAIAD
jgi:DNA mismatch repair protein MutS